MTIEILGRTVEVRSVSQAKLDVLSQDKDCLGFFDGTDILISELLSPSARSRVLIHEVAHAILSISGVSNILAEKQEEAVCTALESLSDYLNLKG